MRGWRREDGWKHQLDYLGPKYIEISDMTRNHKKSALSDERKVWQRKESKGQQAFRSGSSAISRQLFTLHFPERASCYFIPLSPDRLSSVSSHVPAWGLEGLIPVSNVFGTASYLSQKRKREKESLEGLPWWSSGYDSMFPMRGAQIWSLIKELDLTRHN